MKQTLYFAYGSNLDPARMRRRCPTAAPVGPAMLGGWRLAFGGHSRAWGGPVATLVRAADERVDGLLYELALGDLADLDRVEGHPASYRRKRLRVVDGEGYGRLAHVYILPVDAEAPPASDYLGVLWQAYQRLGFDHEPLVAAAGGAG
jgi:hypothetical protein